MARRIELETSGPSEPLDERLGEALEAYLALAEEGSAPDPETFAARYPAELSEELRAALEGLSLVRGLVGSAGGGGPGHRLEAGRELAGYRIVRELGRGGMGIVYDAVHVGLDRPVALKVLGSHATFDATGRRRFLNEARTAAGLHHTHIVPVFDVGQIGGLCYYAMQRIEGCGLDRVLRSMRRDRSVAAGSGSLRTGPDPTRLRGPSLTRRVEETASWPGGLDEAPTGGRPEALGGDRDRDQPPPFLPPRGTGYYRWVAEVGRQAAEALAHAHHRGIIHRDIKPSNLLVDKRGTVWVADFGLARRLADPNQTQCDSLLGTPRYMSPEQTMGKTVDGRTDIYSLGATLYELLTLRPPFEGQSSAELTQQIRDREPPPPRQFDRRIPRDLETIVLKALAKRPSDRYAAADALAEDLTRFLHFEPVRARRISPIGRLWRFARRHPGISLVSTVAAATVLAVATVAYVRVVQERDKALAAHRTSLWRAAENLRFSTVPDKRQLGLSLVQEAMASGAEPELRVKLRDVAIDFLTSRDITQRPALPAGKTQGVVFVGGGPRGGMRLAALSDDGGEFTLWDAEKGERLARHSLEPESAAAARDGLESRTGPRDLLRDPWSHPARIAAVWGWNRSLVAVVPPDGRGIRLFDAESGKPAEGLALPGREIVGLYATVTVVGGRRPFPATRLVTVERTGGARPPKAAARSGDDGPPEGFEVNLWDFAALDRPLKTLERYAPTGEQPAGALSPPLVALATDGRLIATARGFGTEIKVFHPADGQQRSKITTQAPVTALALGRDGVLAFFSGAAIRLWEGETESVSVLSPTSIGLVRLLRFNPGGTLLAAAGPSSELEFWDLTAHARVMAIRTPDRVDDLAFTRGSSTRRLAAAGPGTSIPIWEVFEPVGRTALSGLETPPTTVAFHPNGKALAIGLWNATIRWFWCPGEGSNGPRFWFPIGPPLHAASPSGEPTASGPPRIQPVLFAFDAQGDLLAGDLTRLCWFPAAAWGRALDRGRAADSGRPPSGGRSPGPGRRGLNPPPGTEISLPSEGEEPHATPLVGHFGSTFVVALPSELLFYHSGEARPFQRLPLPAANDGLDPANGRDEPTLFFWRHLAVSPTGDRIYLSDQHNGLVVFARDGSEVRRLDWRSSPADVTALALSPDGRTLAVGDRTGRVVLFETGQGAVGAALEPLPGDGEHQVMALAFDPRGHELAVASQEQVRLWSLDGPAPSPLGRLPGHRGVIASLAYDPTGTRLACGSQTDRAVEVWDLGQLRRELNAWSLGW